MLGLLPCFVKILKYCMCITKKQTIRRSVEKFCWVHVKKSVRVSTVGSEGVNKHAKYPSSHIVETLLR